jgi:hypothetical protein
VGSDGSATASTAPHRASSPDIDFHPLVTVVYRVVVIDDDVSIVVISTSPVAVVVDVVVNHSGAVAFAVHSFQHSFAHKTQ